MALYLEGKTALARRMIFPPKEATQMSMTSYIGMDVHKEAIVNPPSE